MPHRARIGDDGDRLMKLNVDFVFLGPRGTAGETIPVLVIREQKTRLTLWSAVPSTTTGEFVARRVLGLARDCSRRRLKKRWACSSHKSGCARRRPWCRKSRVHRAWRHSGQLLGLCAVRNILGCVWLQSLLPLRYETVQTDCVCAADTCGRWSVLGAESSGICTRMGTRSGGGATGR